MRDGVILDVELIDTERFGEPVSFDKRRASGLESDNGITIERQELSVTPERLRPRSDYLARQRLLHSGVVVINFQRTEAFFTDRHRLDLIAGAAFPAFESFDK